MADTSPTVLFSVSPTIEGYQPPYTFSSSGLPDGFTINNSGVVSGVATKNQSGTATVYVSKNSSVVGTLEVPFAITNFKHTDDSDPTPVPPTPATDPDVEDIKSALTSYAALIPYANTSTIAANRALLIYYRILTIILANPKVSCIELLYNHMRDNPVLYSESTFFMGLGVLNSAQYRIVFAVYTTMRGLLGRPKIQSIPTVLYQMTHCLSLVQFCASKLH